MGIYITILMTMAMPISAWFALKFRGKDLGMLPTVLMIAFDVCILGMFYLTLEAFEMNVEDYKRYLALGFMFGTTARVAICAKMTMN